jgi:hypothetical protein
MAGDLATDELVALIQRVFAPGSGDRSLSLLVDLPRTPGEDREEWRQRRQLAAAWGDRLGEASDRLGLEVALYLFPATGANNADLPPKAWPVAAGENLPASAMELGEADAAEPAVPMEEVLARHDLLLAPTQYSATAPLKVAARRHRFRAATMPGFSAAMVPALRLDFEEVDRRVRRIAGLLDQAEAAELLFRIDGNAEDRLRLDLRFRSAHVSSALLREPGQVGNLPSGEAYIVPYEGEREGEPSRSEGVLPVELDGEVVRYRIAANRAVEVLTTGAVSSREAERLAREPAYGNLAELGLGVLAGMKPASSFVELPPLEPIGSILLDEKLGLHIAFGRSDHFGGAIGPGDFSAPGEVVHIDRIYLPSLQPRVTAALVELISKEGERVELMRDGAYTIGFD